MDNLKEHVRTFPLSPGVYLMKDQKGTVLYIGKAKKLRQRVNSYLIKNKQRSGKIKRMLFHTATIDIIQTDTELDALLLECTLIQHYRPMYNQQMNRFEQYIYLNLVLEKDTVQLMLAATPVGDYSFGPYTHYRQLPKIKAILEKIYGLSPNTTWSALQELPAEFPPEVILEELLQAFDGHSAPIEKRLETQMLLCAEQQHFRQAAQWRDDWRLLQSFFQKHTRLLLHTIAQKEWRVLWLPTTDGKKCYLIYQGLIIKEKLFPSALVKEEIQRIKLAESLLPQTPAAITTFSKEQIDFITILSLYLRRNTEQQLFTIKK